MLGRGRRVILAGDSLKDFHWAGGEPGLNRNRAKDSDPRACRQTQIILSREGESPTRLHCFGRGLPYAPTPQNIDSIRKD